MRMIFVHRVQWELMRLQQDMKIVCLVLQTPFPINQEPFVINFNSDKSKFLLNVLFFNKIECSNCSDGQYAYPGSATCSPQFPCTAANIVLRYTACVAPGQRTRYFEYVQPIYCNTSAFPLPNPQTVACETCNPGTFRDPVLNGDYACHMCPTGYYSAGINDSCHPCGTVSFEANKND